MSDLDDHIDVESPHDLDLDGAYSSSGNNPSKRRLAPFVALAIAVVMIGLFVLLAGSKTRQNAETAATPLLGKPAPQFQSPMLAGGTFDLAAQRGNVVILNFFTSNCVPCIAEQPELVKFANAETVKVGGAKLVSVMFDDSPDAVTKFFTSTGGAWPVVNDKGLPSNYGVAQVPETFVIDVNGIVKYHTISQMTAACLTSMAASAQDLNSLQFDPLPGCGQ